MKKKLLILLILLFVPIFVKADSIKLNCPSQVNANSEFSCEVTGNTSDGVTDLSFKFNLSDSLTFVTFVRGSSWNGEGDLHMVALYGSSALKGTFKIGTLKLRSSNTNGNISLNDIFFYNDEKSINVDPTSAGIKVINNNAAKSNNNSNNNNNNNNAANNNNNTSNSNNVKPASSSKKESTVVENKNETVSTDIDNGDIYLTSLNIKGYDINFRSDVFNYDLKISDEDKLDIEVTTNRDDVSYEIYNNENLKNGSQIYIELNGDNKIQTYYINIVKEEKKKNSFIPLFIAIIVILVVINVIRLFRKRKNTNE